MPYRIGTRRESVRLHTNRRDCPGVSHRTWHKFFRARLRSCFRSAHRTFHISSGALLLILGDICQVQHWDICVCTSGIWHGNPGMNFQIYIRICMRPYRTPYIPSIIACRSGVFLLRQYITNKYLAATSLYISHKINIHTVIFVTRRISCAA